MSDIRMLVEIEILGFIDFLNEKGYFLRNNTDEHSTITYEILKKYMHEYLNKDEI